jgi:hypothetical protein
LPLCSYSQLDVTIWHQTLGITLVYLVLYYRVIHLFVNSQLQLLVG